MAPSSSASSYASAWLGNAARAVAAHARRDIASRDKPIDTPTVIGTTVGIVSGICIFGTLVVLFFLHRRKKAQDRKEDEAINDLELEGDFDESAYVTRPPPSWSKEPHLSGSPGPDAEPFGSHPQKYQARDRSPMAG